MKFIHYTDLQQFPGRADELFEVCEKESIFSSRAWFNNLVDNAVEDGQSVLLVCVVDGDQLLACLPLVSTNSRSLNALKHRYTSLYTLLLAEDNRDAIVACLVRGLESLPYDAVILEPVADNDSGLALLQQGMEAAGYECHRQFRFYNWYHRVQGQSFQSYMAQRPSRVRNTLERKKRKLERETDYEIRLYAGDEVPHAMSDYHQVYNASWKAREQYVNLLNGIVTLFSAAGWSRLAVLYIDKQPVAAQLWFVQGGKASIFRLAYDESWKRYSPGSLLTGYLMEYVIDTDQVEEIDFLTGNDSYKQDWMSARRERWALSCVKRRPQKPGKPDSFIGVLKRVVGLSDS